MILHAEMHEFCLVIMFTELTMFVLGTYCTVRVYIFT